MVPGPPVNLEVSFEEDLRPGFVGHAFLYLMWDIPESKRHNYSFPVIIILLFGLLLCRFGEFGLLSVGY